MLELYEAYKKLISCKSVDYTVLSNAMRRKKEQKRFVQYLPNLLKHYKN